MALTRACAAYPAKIDSVVSSSLSKRSRPRLGHDQHALDDVLVDHRHEEHRLRAGGRRDGDAARIGIGIAQPDALAVLGDPAGQSLADPDSEGGGSGSFGAGERALEGDRLAGPGLVVDAVDPDGIVVDEAASLGHDGASDAGHVMDPVQADGQVGDRAQPVGQRARQFGEPRIPDGGRHVVREGPGKVHLALGPGIRMVVVEDQQALRLAAEDDRHEADRPDPGPKVDVAQVRKGVTEVAVHDLDPLLTDRRHARRRRVPREGRHELQDLRRQAALGGQGQRQRRLAIHPQSGLIDAEERERLIDDVLEEAGQVLLAADDGRDPEQGRAAIEVYRGVAGGRPGRARWPSRRQAPWQVGPAGEDAGATAQRYGARHARAIAHRYSREGPVAVARHGEDRFMACWGHRESGLVGHGRGQGGPAETWLTTTPPLSEVAERS